MKNIVLIGNSHLGCLRKWWMANKESRSLNGLDFTFYAAPGDHLTRVRRVGAKLRTEDKAGATHFLNSSGKGTEVWLKQYDAVVLHGLCFPTIPLNGMLKNFSLVPSADRAFLTSGCLKASLRGAIEKTPFIRLAREIKAVVDLPVIVSMGPFLSEAVLQARPDDATRVAERGAFLKKIYLDELTALTDELGLGLSLQPEETLKSPVLTKAEFTIKHISPNINDYGHMNPRYGGLVMPRLADRLTLLTQAA